MEIRKIRNGIPNAITMLNLLSGASSVIMALSGDLIWASWFIFLAAVFDFLDGFFARLLHARSDIGAQLDSLADVVSFGLAPATVFYVLMSNSPGLPGIYIGNTPIFPFVSMIILIASAYRLARFNNEPGQQVNFSGLPTPSTGIFVASFPLMISQYSEIGMTARILGNHYVLLAAAAFLSYLMVSRIPMVSLKFSSYSWTDNKTRYLLLVTSVVLIILFRYSGIAMSILAYIILSVIDRKAAFSKK